jgi:hypothetical protein
MPQYFQYDLLYLKANAISSRIYKTCGEEHYQRQNQIKDSHQKTHFSVHVKIHQQQRGDKRDKAPGHYQAVDNVIDNPEKTQPGRCTLDIKKSIIIQNPASGLDSLICTEIRHIFLLFRLCLSGMLWSSRRATFVWIASSGNLPHAPMTERMPRKG